MTNRTPEKLLAASAVALEGASLALLWDLAAGGGLALELACPLALLAHAAGAACAAAFLVRRATRLRAWPGAPARGLWALAATASAVLPVVGPVALAILIGRLARDVDHPDPVLVRARLTDLAGASVLPAEASAQLSSTVAAPLGQGSLEARLRFDPDPARRVAAVLATRRLRNPADATRLLRLALRDRDEDVRLLAHALVEDRDRAAYGRIDELERAHAAAPAGRGGQLACLLAEALLDLCTSGLVGGELESFTLRRARALLEAARLDPRVATMPSAALLWGRILLRQGETLMARAALDESYRLGAPLTMTAVHLAEVAFQAREWSAGVEVKA